MSRTVAAKLAWIVNTIRMTGRISFEDLSRRWANSESLSDGQELSRRTFHKWKNDIREIFGLDIRCEQHGSFRYYISNLSSLRKDSLESWLLGSCSISGSLMESKALKDRILLEDIPSGQEYLEPVIEAMRSSSLIEIEYLNFSRGDRRMHRIMPLCIKIFRQRWYVVGKEEEEGRTAIFCLDRICSLRMLEDRFTYPEDFSPDAFFHGCIGVFADRSIGIERIVIRASSSQANYIRSLPFMPRGGQTETERTATYSIFEFEARPSLDLKQELLWHMDSIEVLEPAWLRKDMADTTERMAEIYRKTE